MIHAIVDIKWPMQHFAVRAVLIANCVACFRINKMQFQGSNNVISLVGKPQTISS